MRINLLKYFLKINYFFWIKLFNFIFFITVIFFTVLVYNSDTAMFKAIDLFDEKTQNSLNISEKRNKFMKFVQNFNFTSSNLFNLNSGNNYNNYHY